MTHETNECAMQPSIMHKFRASVAQPILHSILHAELAHAVYMAEHVEALGTKLGVEISSRLASEPGWDRYKFITNVVVSQPGPGSRMSSSCVWDSNCDSVVRESFVSPNIRCTASVFAIYCY
ncbi:hypothetical protein IW148_003916 [Coemansia sp. RSA 1199]|nr:hypothetical protein IW148_003916 [Coemansia sp. RSA 1199]